MASAQAVLSDLSSPGAGPVLAGMTPAKSGSGLLGQAEALERQKASDPQIQKASENVEKSAQEAEQTVTDTQKKLEGMDKAEDIQPWDADKQSAKYSTDSVRAFGSAGSLFAILASAFTHRPMINALNGASAAMNAIRQGDSEAYSRAYDAWKENTDLAMKRHEMQMSELKDIFEIAKDKPAIAQAELQAYSAKYEDAITSKFNEIGAWEKIAQVANAREETKIRMMEASAKMIPAQIFRQSIDEFKKSNGRAPNAQETANLWGQAQFSGMSMSPDAAASAGAQAAAGMPLNQVVPGYGKEASQRREQVREQAVKQIMSENPGMSASDAGLELANRTIQFQSGKRSVGQLYTMLGATRQAVSQLDFNIQKTKEEMKRLPSTNISPVINAIARGEQKWTGDPAYSSLFYFMNATAMESARILQGGQASVAQLHAGAAEEAKQWANVNMTPASFDSVADSMKTEGENRISTFEDAIKAQEMGLGSSVGAIPPGTVEDGFRFNGGDPADQRNWTRVVP